MNILSQWVLSLIGVVVIGVLVDVIIYDGQTSKFIKSMFAIVIVFVMVQPIPKIISGDISLEFGGYEESSASLDEDYLNFIYDIKVEEYKRVIAGKVESYGYTCDKIEIDGSQSGGKISIKNVKVVISIDKLHIDILDKIKGDISMLMNIPKETVKVDGREEA